ncbi:hypothetical protein M434DRAFT_30497 [Hypoxylon sp. CO27-5]|nr:hypothetical protein M434DRAFT_30497 [Hypoxylon sp. CO27-5]
MSAAFDDSTEVERHQVKISMANLDEDIMSAEKNGIENSPQDPLQFARDEEITKDEKKPQGKLSGKQGW